MDLVADEPRSTGADFVEELKAAGDLDRLFARIDAGEVELTGSDGPDPGADQGGAGAGAAGRADRSPGL